MLPNGSMSDSCTEARIGIYRQTGISAQCVDVISTVLQQGSAKVAHAGIQL